jgi:predicted MFS family arabinose efflux permease
MHEERPAAAGERSALPRLTPAELLLLFVLAALQFTHSLDYMIMMPLMPNFGQEMDVSPQQFGFLVASYAFSAGIFGLLAALFIDRFDRKRAVLVLYAGFTVGTLLCGVAPGYLTLLLARTVAGAFGGVVQAVLLAIIGDVFPDRQRGRAMGIVMTSFSVALIAGLPIGLTLAERFGWHSPFQMLGLASGLVWLLAARVLPPLRGHLARGRNSTADLWAALAHPSHVRAYVLMIALVFSTLMIVPYLADYFVENVGRPRSELRWVYLIGGLSTLVALPLVGRIADRYPKLTVFRVFALLAIIPALVTTHLPPVSFAVATAASAAFMVVTASRMVPAMAMLTGCALPRYRGSFMTVNSAVQQVAAGLAAIAGGLILGDTKAATPLTGFHFVGYLACAAMVVSVVLAGRLRPDGAEALVAVDVLPGDRKDPTAAVDDADVTIISDASDHADLAEPSRTGA